MKLKTCRSLVCYLSVALAISVWAAPQASPFDLVIVNGRIIDGTGSPWYSGDIGIREGKIVAIGNLNDAPRTRTIDARGMVVAPGFIDPNQLSQGMQYVMVNGVPVIEEGKMTGVLPGKVLRGAGYLKTSD